MDFVLAYLAAKPTGWVLAVLIVALVLFALAAILAAQTRNPGAALVAAGLAFFAAAFLIT